MPEHRLIVECPSFGPGGTIGPRHTCEGDGVSTEIRWRGAPEETRSFVLLVEDLDVPGPELRLFTWVHWIVYDIPADVMGLPEAIPATPRLENGAKQGVTSFGRPGYGGRTRRGALTAAASTRSAAGLISSQRAFESETWSRR